MTKKMNIFCKNIGAYVSFTGGETLQEIYNRLSDQINISPICARVNNKTEDMNYPVFGPKQVEFLSRESGSGRRVYVRSLCMILYKAICDVMPGVCLRIEHSVANGNYCRLEGKKTLSNDDVTAIRTRMQEIVAENIPFRRKEELTEDVIKLFERQGLTDKVKLLKHNHDLYTVYYKLDNVCDSYYGNLASTTGQIDVFDLLPYKDGLLLLSFDRKNPSQPAKPTEQEKMFKAFTEYTDFNHIIGIKNVGELNSATLRGKTSDLINVAEALHEKKIGRISDEITSRYKEGGARIVLIAGPSSSGKTTTTKRLAIQLMTNLLVPKLISLDDYFVNRENTPLDEDGEYDYESLYALDLEQFNKDLNALIAGEEVELPYYNFETGQREYRGNRIKLGENTILLIEGIHGLNPELTAHIEEKMKYKLYVSALTTISIDNHNWIPTTDNRLLRRIIRDSKYRGVSAESTIKRWPSVRRGEEKWIFPYQENADAMFNSSLLFELGVIKEYGEEVLKHVPRNIPEYGEAYRLRCFLNYFTPISDQMIPSTSLLREFLGGSSFHY